MALEPAAHGITVNAIAPGEVSTPMTGRHHVDPTTQERPGIPLGRPGAAAEAAYATGVSFVVDGGLLLTAAQRDD